jgi:hypothetical protein
MKEHSGFLSGMHISAEIAHDLTLRLNLSVYGDYARESRAFAYLAVGL